MNQELLWGYIGAFTGQVRRSIRVDIFLLSYLETYIRKGNFWKTYYITKKKSSFTGWGQLAAVRLGGSPSFSVQEVHESQLV